MATRYVAPLRSLRFGKKSKPTFYLWFEIIDDEYQGGKVVCAYPMPADGGRPSAASKYCRDWTIANEGSLLKGGEYMVYKRFPSSVFEVQLRLVTEERRGRKLTPEQQYIVRLVARGDVSGPLTQPPCRKHGDLGVA
jgi:hypothetical protein